MKRSTLAGRVWPALAAASAAALVAACPGEALAQAGGISIRSPDGSVNVDLDFQELAETLEGYGSSDIDYYGDDYYEDEGDGYEYDYDGGPAAAPGYGRERGYSRGDSRPPRRERGWGRGERGSRDRHAGAVRGYGSRRREGLRHDRRERGRDGLRHDRRERGRDGWGHDRRERGRQDQRRGGRGDGVRQDQRRGGRGDGVRQSQNPSGRRDGARQDQRRGGGQGSDDQRRRGGGR
ncbi:MAG: hypothetical protein LBQ12_00535 [Deltaproteobacteria bacterium]|jgi:hypothetical protein|nr:hypothetical protein [Deltaproteobacteria bacterium]